MLNLHMLQFVQTVYIPRIEMKIFQRGELEITPSNPVRISLFFCVFRLFVFACRFKQLKQHPTRLRCWARGLVIPGVLFK